MDSITHTVAGALVGKAFYSRQKSAQATRVAVFAATLGAVFPDSDIFAAIVERGRESALEIHRGITHSVVCLPIFAILLALGTRWYTRRRGLDAPSLPWLLLIYATSLALHIWMDLVTSWGTMIWSPLSKSRATLDMTSIVDLTLSAIVLAPQVAAWAYRSPGARFRRVGAWGAFSLAALAVYKIADSMGYGFSMWFVLAAAAIFAAIFLAPGYGRFAAGLPRETWCRAGVAVLAAYMSMQAVAHHEALAQVEQFAAARHLQVEQIAAMPAPPSLFRWSGMIRTPEGVYYSRIVLPTSNVPQFGFLPDSPPNRYIAAARLAPSAQRFLWFARFPTISYAHIGALHYVDFSDRRFLSGRTPSSRVRRFAVRITLDDRATVVHEDWAED